MSKKSELSFESFLIQKKIQMETLITEREGMIAENTMRKYMNEAPAYVESSFNRITISLEEISNELAKARKII